LARKELDRGFPADALGARTVDYSQRAKGGKAGGGKGRRTALIAVAVVALLGAGVFAFMNRTTQGESWGQKFNLPFALKSVAKDGKDLHVDFGDAWLAMFENERTSALRSIADGASGMGVDKVLVLSNDKPVAEIRGSRVEILGKK